MHDPHLFFTLLPYLIPLVLISLGIEIFAIIDLFRADRRVRGNNKWLWLACIVLFETIGPIVYLLFGREDL